MAIDRLSRELGSSCEVAEWRHATAILESDFPQEWSDIAHVLSVATSPRRQKSPRKANSTHEWEPLRNKFYAKGWREWQFYTKLVVDSTRFESPTHEITCLKGRVAMELEGDNVDHLYDRHLSNFRALFDLRAISVGVIVTRSDDLRTNLKGSRAARSEEDPAARLSKLVRLMNGASSGGCPILAIGIKATVRLEPGGIAQTEGVVKAATQ